MRFVIATLVIALACGDDDASDAGALDAETDSSVDALEAILFALPEIRGFIEDRFAGVPFVEDCSVPEPVRCMGSPD